MVTFIKADGTIRKMRATRNTDLIPPDKFPKSSMKDKAVVSDNHERDVTNNPEGNVKYTTVVKVFDTEIQEWRSIRAESVQSMKVVV